jgi:hypothetical protein
MSQIYRDFSKRTVLTATPDLPRHSEASIIELKDGSLLMAWQRHEKSKFGSGDEAPSTISLMNSYDDAKTWVNERVVAKMTEGSVNVYSPSFVRRKDGGISLFFRRYTCLVIGKKQLCSFYRIDSYDEGETWGEEHVMWENQTYGIMNDAFKRLSDGTLLAPVEEGVSGEYYKGERCYVSVLRSDDDMETYTQSEKMSVPMRGLMEPCIAERPDGSLNMIFRTQLGSVFYSESFDGGKSWTKAQTTGLRAPESCPCIVSVPNSDAQIVVWNNSEYDMKWRSHYGRRSPLTMAVSRDGLKTFTDFFDIEDDPTYAYSNPSFTVTSDGLFILNYWSCKYTEDWLFGPLIDLNIATFRVDCK